MSNTLETKTIEQLSIALQSYNTYMCEIPEKFNVLEEYLHGLTALDFCAAFKKLQEIVVNIYNYLYDNPKTIGLVIVDKKTGELKVQTSQHISCIKKLLYVLGRHSNLDENVLSIPMELLMNAYMTYYPNISVELAETIKEYDINKRNKFFESKHMRSVFECLQMFGFKVEGLEDSEIKSLRIQYPQQPSVIIALKAFSTPNICRISFGFDFTKFNYRVFSHASNAKIPLEDLYSYCLLPTEHQKFLSELNQAMKELNVDYGECESGWYNGTLPCQYIYKNKIRILQNIENGLMPAVVVRFGKKADKITKLIESFPPEFYNSIARCRGCKKGGCDHRISVTAAGEKYVLCNIAWWGFPPVVDAVPYIVKAYTI